MTLEEAKQLKPGDKVIHNFLRTIYIVDKIKTYKSNPNRVEVYLKKGEWNKWKVKSENLHKISKIV